MFRLSILIVLVIITFLFLKNKNHWSALRRLPHTLLFSLRQTQLPYLERLRLFSFSWMLLLFGLLALSGFGPVLLFGESPEGYLLIFHLLLAPFFLVALTFWLLSSTESYILTEQDWQTLNEAGKSFLTHRSLGLKIVFWLFYLISLLGIGAAVLSFFPFFNAEQIQWLIGFHGYSMLFLFLIAALAYFYYFSSNLNNKIEEK